MIVPCPGHLVPQARRALSQGLADIHQRLALLVRGAYELGDGDTVIALLRASHELRAASLKADVATGKEGRP
ncbi:hypothetical protein LZC95_19400 [Pendulispora brunnea]|uniref:Uncharacterized protein n=1 Tax=Pendulispora brunnea TaxID=2905690 RepID=A0ABZ2KJZ0_9BACT